MEDLCCLGDEAAQDGKPKLFLADFGKTKPGRRSLRRGEGVSQPGLGAGGSQAAVWAISGFAMVSLMLIKKRPGGLLGNKGFPGQFWQNKARPAIPETWGGSGLTRSGRQGVIGSSVGRFRSCHGFWLNNTCPGQMYFINAFPGPISEIPKASGVGQGVERQGDDLEWRPGGHRGC
jgi:hypothetical protein